MALTPKPFHGHYPLQTMRLAIRMVAYALTSLRGTVRCFEIFSEVFPREIPCYVTVQNWLLTFGLHQLLTAKEHREDWVYILDFTVELGTQKCLVVLGVTLERLRRSHYVLRHQDVTILAIVVTTQTSGTMIATILNELTEETGVPKQVLSDHGSDVKKGTELFCQEHEDTVYTYDITHKIGTLLKHLLGKHETWQEFVRRCGETKRKTAQSKAGFLTPPKPQDKARWLNLEPFVQWAEKVLAWQSRNEFDSISPAYEVTTESLEALQECGLGEYAERLRPLCTTVFPDAEAFLAAVEQTCSVHLPEPSRKLLLQHTSCGRRKFDEYFGWLNDFVEPLQEWRAILEVLQAAKDEVKHHGLSHSTAEAFRQRLTPSVQSSPTVANLIIELYTFLHEEAQPIPEGQTWLGTSDVIESIFGKYKNFSGRSSLKGIGRMILSIAVFTAEPTPEAIQEAMETLRFADVTDWLRDSIGTTLFAKRKAALGIPKEETVGRNAHKAPDNLTPYL